MDFLLKVLRDIKNHKWYYLTLLGIAGAWTLSLLGGRGTAVLLLLPTFWAYYKYVTEET